MLTNQEKLNQAIKSIQNVVRTIDSIYHLNKKAFDGNEDLTKDFALFKKVAANTIERLEHPVLSIAMVGTTSAGKSTLVNAFLGRKVAPVEAKEMSAGVLHLTHSDSISLNVHPTPNAKWKTGAIDVKTDADIYGCISEIFNTYHVLGSKVAAPHISVSGPIEWQTNKSLLGLPDNLRIEFIDLPGLKTINDPQNLSVIQKMLSKALCVVAMDFGDVDPSRIQRLLDEVKDIVKSLNNNTEFLLFLLNKVDSAKAGQINVPQKIEELQSLIKQALDLSEQKEIIPFIGHLLYLIQLGVIKDSKNGKIISYNNEYLSNIFSDIANVFIQKYKNKEISKEEYCLSEEIKNMTLLEEEIPVDKISDFYNLCIRMSYADKLYADLSRRIDESFSHIVIRPTMDDYFKYLSKLLSDLETYINISRNSSVLDLISEKMGMLKSRVYLEGVHEDSLYEKAMTSVEGIRNTLTNVVAQLINDDDDNSFLASRIEKDLRKISETISKREKGYVLSQIEDINKSIDNIATSLSTLSSEKEKIAYLNSQKSNRVFAIFNGISDIPKEISKSLTSNYLDEFRGMIASKQSAGLFMEKMCDKMSSSLATEFNIPYSTLYNLFYSHFSGFTKNQDKYTYKSTSQKSESWKSIADNGLRSANIRVRDVLSKLTNVEFQKETTILVGSIENYLDSELQKILTEIQLNANIQSADIAELLTNTLAVSKASIELPEELFTFSTPSGVSSKTNEVSGTRTRVVPGVCCDDTITENVYSDYYNYSYDNEIGCYNRWKSGIDGATSKFWQVINEWLKKQVDMYMSQIQAAIIQVSNMIDTMFDNRLKEVQEQNYSDIAKLDKMSAMIVEAQNVAKEAILE